MNKKTLSIALISMATLAAIAFVLLKPDSPAAPATVDSSASSEPETEGSTAAPDSVLVDSREGDSLAPESAPSADQPIGAEVLATRRMVAAHASLRSEEVNDPDSATNRRIKSQLIQRALANAAAAQGEPGN